MPECIDVFCHILLPEYIEAAKKVQIRPLPMFDRAQAIPMMIDLNERFRVLERFPDYKQVLSLVSPGPELIAEPANSPDLARLVNDGLAELSRAHPERFPTFVATLPLNSPEASLREAERAVTQLGAAGVQLYTNVLGRPLDRPEFLAIFDLMAKFERAVWIHPIRSQMTPDYVNEPYSKNDLWWSLGWPHETSLAMGRLAFAGIFDRWPDLVVITHHAGGTIPMLEGRVMAGLDTMYLRTPPGMEEANRSPLREAPGVALRRFYADTATFGSRATLECGLKFFGAERMMFASDSPFDPELGPGFIREGMRILSEMDLTAAERHAIMCGNARRKLRLAATR